MCLIHFNTSMLQRFRGEYPSKPGSQESEMPFANCLTAVTLTGGNGISKKEVNIKQWMCPANSQGENNLHYFYKRAVGCHCLSPSAGPAIVLVRHSLSLFEGIFHLAHLGTCFSFEWSNCYMRWTPNFAYWWPCVLNPGFSRELSLCCVTVTFEIYVEDIIP